MREQLEIDAAYAGYLDRQAADAAAFRRDEDLTLMPPNQGVTGVAFSPDGALLASAHRDRALKVWDVEGKAVLTLRRAAWLFSIPAMQDLQWVNDGLPMFDRMWLKTH